MEASIAPPATGKHKSDAVFKLPAKRVKAGAAVPKIPDKWTECPRQGNLVGNSRLLPIKTLLDERFDNAVAEEDRFTPAMFVETQLARQREVALLIDVSGFAQSYYEDAIFDKLGVPILRIPRSSDVPSNEELERFNMVVTRALSAHSDPNRIIAVSDLWGYNRAGVFIVCYLCDEKDWSLAAALSAFAEARPPGIYNAHYLRALAERYAEAPDVAPAPPQWDSLPAPKPYTQLQLPAAVPAPLSMRLRDRVAKLIGVTEFSKAIFMGKSRAHHLTTEKYLVTWRPCGIRFWMLIFADGVYLMDANGYFFPIEMHFPLRNQPGKVIDNTIIDGNMVVDMDPGTRQVRFLACDCLAFNKYNLCATAFDKRLKVLRSEVIAPRKDNKTHDFSREAVHLRPKDYFLLKNTRTILSNFAPSLPHGFGGLIFASCASKYEPGRHSALLFWTEHVRMEIGEKTVECKWDGNDWQHVKVCTDELALPTKPEVVSLVSGADAMVTAELLEVVQQAAQLPLYMDEQPQQAAS